MNDVITSNNELKAEVQGLKASNDKLKAEVLGLETKVTTLKAKVTTLEAKIVSHKDKNGKLKSDIDKVRHDLIWVSINASFMVLFFITIQQFINMTTPLLL